MKIDEHGDPIIEDVLGQRINVDDAFCLARAGHRAYQAYLDLYVLESFAVQEMSTYVIHKLKVYKFDTENMNEEPIPSTIQADTVHAKAIKIERLGF